jgi:serine/threonine-protein kinase RsbW
VHVPNEVKDENLRPANSASAPPAAEIVHIPLDAIPQEADAAQPFVVQREFVFPGDLASVPESRQQVMQFVEEHCSSQGDQIDIPVALQEALANAALHGCGDDPAKRIHCIVAVDASDITITVRDPGPGFDLTLADPDSYAASTLTHGRGICLMRSLMTDVFFAYGGAEIKLRKSIDRG